MTVFGIAGCTALILTAFGVRDSIRTVVDRQFGELFKYDVTIGLDSKGIPHLNDTRILDYMLLHKESGKIIFNDVKKDISIVAPEDLENIDDYISLLNRKDENRLQIPENGV